MRASSGFLGTNKMNTKKIIAGIFVLCLIFSLCACVNEKPSESTIDTETVTDVNESSVTQNDNTQTDKENMEMQLAIGDKKLTVKWEDNASVNALMELCSKEPLTIQMSMYGGFEQVGSIGTSLPRDDKQTTTSAGDIVLYSGNQIVVFYGSNSWSYTRLGKITNLSDDDLTKLLGNGNVTLTISVKAIPHNSGVRIAQSDFSSDRTNFMSST